MNTIINFPRQVELPDLNIGLLRQAAAATSKSAIEVKQLFIQTNYLPSLHTRISELDRAVRNVNSKLRENVQSLDISLNINVQGLQALQQELDTAPDYDKQEILEEIAEQVSKVIDVVNRNKRTLDRLMPSLITPIDRTATSTYILQLEADEVRLPIEIQANKARQHALEEKRTMLTQAMAIIEAKGFSQIAKETALTAQGLAQMGMKPPELAAIEGAILLAQQVLEKVEDLINYLGLIEARNSIRKQIDDLVVATYDMTAELRGVTLKKNLIIACHDFDDQRAQYVTEFEKFIYAKQSFLAAYQTVDAQDKDTIAQFTVNALSLARHLKAAG